MTPTAQDDEVLGSDDLRLRAQIELAVDEERRRIAGEIHDALNASLIVIRLHAEGIVHQASAAGHNDIAQAARSIKDTADKAYSDMKHVAKQLRPELLDALGLAGALAAMVRELDEAQSDCRFEFESAASEPRTTPSTAMTAYRVAQEALSNAIKHAKASLIKITLGRALPPHCLTITIVDNGRGFDSDQVASGRLGLLGMRERVRACSGELTINSGGTGTSIAVIL